MDYELRFEQRDLIGFQSRLATPADAEAMVLLTKQAVASRKGEAIPTELVTTDEVDNTRRLLDDPSTWSMLVEHSESGKIVGLVLGYPEKDAEFVPDLKDKEHLSLLMIDPNYQGLGIGSLLLDWATSHLRDKGTKAIYLWTEVDNHLSRPAYEHKGWRLTGAERIHPKYKDAQVQYVFEFL